MNHIKWWIGTTGATLALAAVLYGDAHEYTLSGGQPGSSREKGCYTILDNLLNAHSPADFPWTRAVEEQSAKVLFCVSGATGLIAIALTYRRRGESHISNDDSRIQQPQ